MGRINLTQYTDAGGCGCKIAPNILAQIIDSCKIGPESEMVLVGNYFNDDAAVIKLDEMHSLVFTDDFFTPIVDDPYSFGKIAAANALSDIFAMGGTAIAALSILGWPVDVINVRHAKRVMQGAKSVCDSLGIPLAGGHSINNPQPIFGLSVIGKINSKNLKQNNAAKPGDLLYLTKPLGSGIYSTSLKLGIISPKDKREMLEVMGRLNNIGTQIGQLSYVNSMTDITGFGLVGHLIEICKASKVSAELNFQNIKLLTSLKEYIDLGIVTSGGKRNQKNFKKMTESNSTFQDIVLNDPQTNGGLLVSVKPSHKSTFESFLVKNYLEKYIEPIGLLKPQQSNKKIITVR